MCIIRTKFLLDWSYNNDRKLLSISWNHNPNWLYVSGHPYRILITDGAWSGKANILLNLIKHQQPYTDKIYLYAKDQFESRYQLLINGREKVEIKN